MRQNGENSSAVAIWARTWYKESGKGLFSGWKGKKMGEINFKNQLILGVVITLLGLMTRFGV